MWRFCQRTRARIAFGLRIVWLSFATPSYQRSMRNNESPFASIQGSSMSCQVGSFELCYSGRSGGSVLKLRKIEAITRLNRRVESIDSLKNALRHSPEFKKWRRDTEVAIEYIFGAD